MNYQSIFFYLSNILHVSVAKSIIGDFDNDLDYKVNNLHSRYDGEASKKAHGAPYC